MSDKLDPIVVVEKADIDATALPNSILNAQQANRFIDLVVDQSALLRLVRVVKIDHPTGEINKLDLGSIVSEGAGTTTTATTHTPTESVVTYTSVKYRSAFDLSTDFVEDNIEGGTVRDTLLNMFTKRIGTDAELAAIEGDDSLATGDAQTQENNLLGVNDGWKVILAAKVPAAQKVDAAGAASSRKLFYDMKRKIQRRYRIARPDYRWLLPPSVWDKWELDEGESTPAAGSEAAAATRQAGTVGRRPFGIPQVEVPLMPEDLTYGTAVTDGSEMWLSPLLNFLWFIQRDITIEWDRIPRQDKWEVTIHWRADVEVENEQMVIIAQNVSESGSDYS